ncbi:MAG TPA: hypothetical protein VFV96_11575 [Verrucomicrobiae bacterium]|nr:hypothetical protein [Verrucomicrobiae bacterium]
MKHFLLLAVITAVLALPALAQPQSTFNTSLTLAPADAQSSGSGAGGDEQAKAAELARKLQNPVAALISVPIQNNWDFGIVGLTRFDGHLGGAVRIGVLV